MSTHTSPDDTPGPGYTTTRSEKALALIGIVAGGFFVLVCVDLVTGGRLSAPVRAAIPNLEEVTTADD